MTIKVRGKGYGVKEVEYEKLDIVLGKWVPISKSAMSKLLRDGNSILMNPTERGW